MKCPGCKSNLHTLYTRGEWDKGGRWIPVKGLKYCIRCKKTRKVK